MEEKQTITSVPGAFFRDKTVLLLFIASFLINSATWIYLLLSVKPQANPIFLHYTIYFGVDLIGPWYRLLLMPAAGLVALCLNLALAHTIYSKTKIVSYSIIGSTLLVGLIIFLASFLIVRQINYYGY